MWNAKKLSYACKKFVERQNCDATILQGSRWMVAFFGIIYVSPDAKNANALLVTIVPYQGFMSQTHLLL
jgi:hypothetical protein